MKKKRRRYKTFSDVDPATWTKCKVHNQFGAGYAKIIKWVNDNTDGYHSRSDESFWFENEKDAFKFKLKWGEGNGEEK